MSSGHRLEIDAESPERISAPRGAQPHPASRLTASTRHRVVRRLRAPALALAFVLFVGVGVFGVARDITGYALYRGFTPIRIPSWIEPRATLKRVWVRSTAVGGRIQPVVVGLPPGYARNPLRRYPVLYLLHGYPEFPGAFLSVGQVVAREDILVYRHLMRRLIMVIPYGTTGFFTDKEWANGIRPGNDWETFVARDVVNAIDRGFRTIPTGAGRAIGGLSSGAYGALNIALHHPGEFRVVESWSGYTHAPVMPSIFGTDPARAAYNSPALYLPEVATALRAARTFVWFYIGARDGGLPRNREFASELAAYGIRYEFFTVLARHDWAAWRPNVSSALIAASSHMLPPITPTSAPGPLPQVKLPRSTPGQPKHA